MKHYQTILVLIVLAALVGIIHAVPHGLGWALAPRGDSSPRTVFLYGADEEHYLVQLGTAYDGVYQPGNRYLFEHARRGDEAGEFALNGINLQGVAMRLSGVAFLRGIVLQRFFMPMVAFLLLASIFFVLFEGRVLPACIFAAATILSPYLLFGHVHFIDRLLYEYIFPHQSGWNELMLNAFLPFARMVNPQFTGLFFLASLVLIILFAVKPRGWVWLLIALPFFWLTYKVYFYFWTALGVFVVAVFVLALVYKKRILWLPLLVLVVAGTAYAGIALPRLLSVAHDEYSGVYTFSISRTPIAGPAVVCAVILGGIYYFLRRRFSPTDTILFIAAIATPIVCMNQQVVTGRVVQPWHYEVFCSPIVLWIALAILWKRAAVPQWLEERFGAWGRRTPAARRIVGAVLALLVPAGIVLYYVFHASWAGSMTSHTIFSLCFYIVLWCMLAGGIVAVYMLLTRRIPSWRYVAIGVVLFVIVGDGCERQIYMALRHMPEHRRRQEYARSLEWLDNTTASGSVVAAPLDIAETLPAYTHNYVYLAKNAVHYRLPHEDREERTAVFFNLMGYGHHAVEDLVRGYPYRYILWGMRYFSRGSYDLYSFGKHRTISGEEIKNFLDIYDRYASQPEAALSVYRLDYILVTKAHLEEHDVPAAVSERFTPAFEDDLAVVYRKNVYKKF